jgi:hypothetical protein
MKQARMVCSLLHHIVVSVDKRRRSTPTALMRHLEQLERGLGLILVIGCPPGRMSGQMSAAECLWRGQPASHVTRMGGDAFG